MVSEPQRPALRLSGVAEWAGPLHWDRWRNIYVEAGVTLSLEHTGTIHREAALLLVQ